MTFFEAVAKCYRKYFVYKGRASRSEYWWLVLLAFLFAWPLILAEFGNNSWYTFLSFIYFILTMSVIFPLTSVWSRRMHDINRSGWSWLFIFIPVVGFFLILRWTTKEGNAGENKYGLPDNESVVLKPESSTGDKNG